jgi:hypothetical protein
MPNFSGHRVDLWSTVAATFSVAEISATGLVTENKFFPRIAYPIK